MKIASIVEGHGEVSAFPILLRRILPEISQETPFQVLRPIRITKSKLVQAGELERAVALASIKAGPDGRILVLIDADQDCPAEEAPQMLGRAIGPVPAARISLVLAKGEFEAWFLAAARSLAGSRDLPRDLAPPQDPEGIRDAKGWLSRGMAGNRHYRETIDQPAFAAIMDLIQARDAPSFDKLWRDLERMVL